MTSIKRFLNGTTTLSVFVLAIAQSAHAQTASGVEAVSEASQPTQSSDAADPDAAVASGAPGDSDIVVTGTRVTRTGFSAPTPTTVVGTADLQRTGSTNVAGLLNQLPAFRPTSTTSTRTVGRESGANYLDLRGIGTVRTLVLVNGQRFVPSAITGQVNLNLLPSILIDRTEVVTGGASAAYGSDAVAGVVNIIYKKNFEGIQGEAQYGIADVGDGKEIALGAVYGTAFDGGRGHLTFAGQYVDNKGAGSLPSRDWGRSEALLIANPGFPNNGLPSRLVVPQGRPSTYSNGGVINGGPLGGTQFLDDGTPAPFTYGTLVGGTFMQGGSGHNSGDYQRVASPLERRLLYAGLNYELTPDVEAHVSLSFARSKSILTGGTNFDTNFTIRRDNAFLPASIAQAMDANGVTTFRFGRTLADVSGDPSRPFLNNANVTKVYRAVAGLEGKLGGGWTWSAYYQHGESRRTEYGFYVPVKDNFFRAMDAVVNPTTGAIVCRSTLTNPSDGCIPYNVFGYFVRSPQAASYVTSTLVDHLVFREDVAAASIQGEPFSTWAGPISVAAGAEYRSDRADSETDAISQAFRFFSGNPQPIHGKVVVKEVFGEVVVPLADDMAFARLLELNGAVRYTDYSTSGGVTSWKVGVNYKPTDDIRFRFTRSRDIRAPNVNELFSSLTSLIGQLTDRTNNSQNNISVDFAGNPNLVPETANTLTAGIVVEPSFVPGFRFSVDGYDIRIDDLITTITGQDTIDRCFSGNTVLCDLLTRSPAGILTNVRTPFLNLASLKTRGIDFEALYHLPLDRLSSDSDGALTFRLLATYVDRLAINDGVTTVDVAGETGGFRPNGVPHWSGTFIMNLDKGPLTLSTQVRYIGSGKYDALGTPQNINYLHVPSRTYVQVSGSYQLLQQGDGRGVELFGVIDNLFDKDPPLAPNVNQSYTNTALFDQLGRYFRMGVRFKY